MPGAPGRSGTPFPTKLNGSLAQPESQTHQDQLMTETKSKRRKDPHANDVESLYLDLLRQFYDLNDRSGAKRVAKQLEKMVAGQPEYGGSILGEEIRSLVAEVRGDLSAAIESREAEIRKILELHSIAANTSSYSLVLRNYDHSDVSDRLDLLAILYDQQGNTERAIAILIESKHFCQSHQIPFDGQDLLDELADRSNGEPRAAAPGIKKRLVPAKRRRPAG